jgi:hypothetical protein
LEDESASQAAQRILKEISGVYGSYKLYITSGNPLSTSPEDMSTSPEDMSTSPEDMSTSPEDMSTSPEDMSTNIAETVDTQVAAKLDPVLERLAVLEERLGKLRA